MLFIIFVNHIFIWRTPDGIVRTLVWEYLVQTIYQMLSGPKVYDIITA
jgi:hypothetical protein